MKTLKLCFGVLTVCALMGLSACSHAPAQSPDVSDSIRKSLDQAGLKKVSVSDDRDKGVVTLTGSVSSDADKAQANSVASTLAAGQVVSDQIAVLPPGNEGEVKTVDSDLDKGIEKNLDATLLENHLHKAVSYDVKNGVVTLTGEVHSEAARANAEKLAAGVPNVQQVVNELQVKDQKATSTP